ncbi:head-tail connector protein [Aureimonas sp. D3]|uniref:head-tail connector protein n=1 Tax=Aureimonas sp. D3 TaxID=1638164 RepID=UPI0009E6B583|nr:head-tail connector protein [Aureimonas sp. D3]
MAPSVAELKAQLTIEHDEDDALLAGKIAAATVYMLDYTGRDEVPQGQHAASAYREAILLTAAHLYTHRGDGSEVVDIPATARRLVAAYYEWPI